MVTQNFPWYVARIAWPIGVVFLITLAALLAWLNTTEPRSFSSKNIVESEEDLRQLLNIQQKKNEALRRAATENEKALEEFVCLDDEDSASEGSLLKNSELRKLVKDASVYILTPLEKGAGSGSGFFITENLVMTNAHVVDKAAGDVIVFSESASQSATAKVVAFDYGRGVGTRDYAILKVSDFKAPNILPLSVEIEELMGVYAVGYPGVYQKVFEGIRPDKVPDLIFNDGAINYIETSELSIPIVAHSAEIYKGNSGGPLVNQCGGVVGVNTWYTTPGESAKVKVALGAADISSFAKSHGISPKILSTLCE